MLFFHLQFIRIFVIMSNRGTFLNRIFVDERNRVAVRPELTWTHYRSLLMVKNEKTRQYYLKEAVDQNWGTRALDRQISSLAYERILSSQNKMEVKKHEDNIARQDVSMPQDIIKDPYILEFLDLSANTGLMKRIWKNIGLQTI